MKICGRYLYCPIKATYKAHAEIHPANMAKLLPKELPPGIINIFNQLFQHAQTYPASYLACFELFDRALTSLEIVVGEFKPINNLPALLPPGESLLLRDDNIPSLGRYTEFFNSLCDEIKWQVPPEFKFTKDGYYKIEVFSPAALKKQHEAEGDYYKEMAEAKESKLPDIHAKYQERLTLFSFHIVSTAKP